MFAVERDGASNGVDNTRDCTVVHYLSAIADLKAGPRDAKHFGEWSLSLHGGFTKPIRTSPDWGMISHRERET
jgi:hypothetical protein